MTFGRFIQDKRKELGLSQKDLASRIKRDDGDTISAQYLNDIEHDRRNPTSQHLIEQFAKALKLEPSYLSYLAGQFPEHRWKADPVKFEAAWQAFRKTIEREKD